MWRTRMCPKRGHAVFCSVILSNAKNLHPAFAIGRCFTSVQHDRRIAFSSSGISSYNLSHQ